MSTASTKRLNKELLEIKKPGALPEGCRIFLKDENDIFKWCAELVGPPDSPFQDGRFEFAITLPHNYPFAPPSVKAVTKIYHPNINAQGGICIDILKTQWSPALSVLKVMLSILSLFCDPNPADPLMPDIAKLYTSDRPAFDRTAREWTKRFALPVEPPPKKTPPPPSFKKAAPKTKKQPVVIELD